MLRRFPTLLPAILLLAGCLGTPQPDPPNVFGVDPDRLRSWPSDGPTVRIEGRAGAVYPPEASLRIYPLDRTEAAVDVTPDADGSFSVDVAGAYGEQFRLQVRLGEDRASPLDIIVDVDRVLLPERPLADCLTTTPGPVASLVPGEQATIQVVNECSAPVSLSRIEPRTPDAPFFVVSPTAPVDVPSGGRLPVVVESLLAPGESGEELLLLEISAPQPDRRPITVVGLP